MSLRHAVCLISVFVWQYTKYNVTVSELAGCTGRLIPQKSEERCDNLFTGELRGISKIAVFGYCILGGGGGSNQNNKQLKNKGERQKQAYVELWCMQGSLTIDQPDVLVDPLHGLFRWLPFSTRIYHQKLCGQLKTIPMLYGLQDASKWLGFLRHIFFLMCISVLDFFNGICCCAPLIADRFLAQSSKAKHVLRQNCLKANLTYPLKAQQSLFCLKDIVSVFERERMIVSLVLSPSSFSVPFCNLVQKHLVLSHGQRLSVNHVEYPFVAFL